MNVSKTNIWLKLSNMARYGRPNQIDYAGPKSLCNLFWSGILGIFTWLLFPTQLISKKISGKYLDFWENIAANCGLFLIFLFTSGIYTFLYGTKAAFIWYQALISFVILVLVCLCIVGIFILADYISQKRREAKWRKKQEGIVEKPSVVVEFLKARKNNICPIISYTD